jgi:hypothetical protein
MDQSGVVRYITETFDGVDVVEADGNAFFFAHPGRDTEPDHRMPFATLVTSDAYNRASDLDRPGVFRLNIGVGRETYHTLFGALPPPAGVDGVVETGHDFTVLDQVMPHPVYAQQFWVCVLNPGETTFRAVQLLLTEAYQRSVKRLARKESRDDA